MNINATLFVEMLVFGSFVEISRRYIWPPLISIVNERQEINKRSLEQARESEKKLEEAQTDYRQIIDEAKERHRQIIDSAEEAYEKLLDKAKSDASELKNNAIAQAQLENIQSILKAEKELESQNMGFIHQVLGKVLYQIPDESQLEDTIMKALAEVDREG